MRSLGCKILFAFILVLGSSSFSWAQDEKAALALFSDAVKAYHGARYSEAVDLNESLLSKGYASAAVYYNLGNAYLKSGHLGKSLVNYLRAVRLTPRDSDLRANLSFARSQVENYNAWPRNSIFAVAQKFWSEKELQWVAFISFVVAGTFFLIALYAGLRRKRVTLITGLLTITAAYFLGAVIFQAVDAAGQSVCVERVEARFEPSAQATAYFKIPEGAELKVLREKERWFKVERSDGKTGWVLIKSVERI
jgi:tetratricopeptide (TPR) repeat protein